MNAPAPDRRFQESLPCDRNRDKKENHHEAQTEDGPRKTGMDIGELFPEELKGALLASDGFYDSD